MKELVEAFRALRPAPRALWLVIFAYSAEFMAYIGMITLMGSYLSEDLHIAKEYAHWWISLLTGGLSIVMVLVGKPLDAKVGPRIGIMLALAIVVAGRASYSSAQLGGGIAALGLGVALLCLGEGMLLPLAYSGVKRYTDEKNGPMGYAVLYAFFNIASALIGPVSAKVRTTWDQKHAAGESVLTGFNAVNWVCTAIPLVALIVFGVLMTKKAASQVVRGEEGGAGDKASTGASPWRDKRFLFFIFALLPVRTLFAHGWLTFPQYVLRAYSQDVADRMEWIVDSINPVIIFFGVPLATALTRRFNVLTMMIVGTTVSALAPFLLVFGPNTTLLLGYFIVFSIGEAMWSARFYEYSAELAPEGRTAQYMGVAGLPWFVAKFSTGLYSGFVLERFCPKEGPKSTGTMWLLYGLIAVASPILLVAGRKWLRAGMK